MNFLLTGQRLVITYLLYKNVQNVDDAFVLIS